VPLMLDILLLERRAMSLLRSSRGRFRCICFGVAIVRIISRRQVAMGLRRLRRRDIRLFGLRVMPILLIAVGADGGIVSMQ
jgi:hypothetical protein